MWLDAYVMLIVTHRFLAPRPMGLTLAGADVGMIPFCHSDQWVKKGHLVALALEKFRIVSMLHAVRLKHTGQNDAAERLWQMLTAKPKTSTAGHDLHVNTVQPD